VIDEFRVKVARGQERSSRSRLRGTRRQNSLPAIPRGRCFQNDIAQCAGIDAFIRDVHRPLVFLSQFLPLMAIGGPLQDSRVCFARVGERFPHGVVNIEQPFLSPCLGEAECGPFAVVKDVGGLVDDEVCERIRIAKVLDRDVASGFLAEAHKNWRIRSEKVRTRAGKVEVGQCSGGTIETAVEYEMFNIRAGHEHHRPLQSVEHDFVLVKGE